MTNNIEDKLKLLGILLGIAGAIISTIYGLVVVDVSAVTGFLILVIGIITSILTFCLLYGFGVVIEKLKEIAKNTKYGVNVEIEYPKEKN